MRRWAALPLLALVPAGPATADPLTDFDGAKNPAAYVQGVGPGGALPQLSSVGTDLSASPLAVPTNGVIPGYTLRQSLPVNPTRIKFEAQNQDVVACLVVLDDGANGNVSVVVLGPAPAQGGQGGGWSSQSERGRIRLYTASAAGRCLGRQN